jgi:hypothetical protein
VGDQNKKGNLQMDDEGAEIRELRPVKDRSAPISDRWAKAEPSTAREEAERINQSALRRILDSETRYSLPALDQAVLDVERGRQLLALAGLADDPDREEELAAALDRIVDAAGSRDWLGEGE